jgi:hypothetical protein
LNAFGKEFRRTGLEKETGFITNIQQMKYLLYPYLKKYSVKAALICLPTKSALLSGLVQNNTNKPLG